MDCYLGDLSVDIPQMTALAFTSVTELLQVGFSWLMDGS